MMHEKYVYIDINLTIFVYNVVFVVFVVNPAWFTVLKETVSDNTICNVCYIATILFLEASC